jgi:uncharacterized repeat protein (TIGR01451 family)
MHKKKHGPIRQSGPSRTEKPGRPRRAIADYGYNETGNRVGRDRKDIIHFHTKGEKVMINSVKNRSSGFIRTALVVITLTALWMTALPFSAQAALQGSAGNTIIRNTVTVSFNNALGVAQTPVTASVQITVNTVLVAPTVLSFAPASGSTDGTSDTEIYSVTIRTNANGPGTVSFATVDGTFINVAAGAAPSVPANIFLGSTLIDPSDAKNGVAQNVAAGGNITFAVPNDGGVPTDTATTGGATGDGVINGLRNGDLVYLHSGTAYYGPFTVGTVTDPAPGAGTTATPGSIQLTNTSGGALAFTPAYGWMIVEAKSANVTVTQGAVTNPALAASWVTTVTATMGGNNGVGTVTTTAHSGALTVLKEISTDGITFTTTPASSVNPGATLYYRITVTNTGTGNATSVVLTDPQPTYTTYVAGSARRATGAAVAYGSAAALTDATDGDGYDFGVTTTRVATYSVGIITPGVANQVQFFFRVTVN